MKLFFVLYHFLCNLLFPLALYFNINAMYCVFSRIISYVTVISNELYGFNLLAIVRNVLVFVVAVVL